MKKGITCLLVLAILFSMNVFVFAAEEEPICEDELIEEYVSVIQISTVLTKSASTAICKVNVRRKIELDSVYGSFNLVDSNGKTVASDNRYLQKSGANFVYTHGFNMPKSGTYKVKCTLKTYKNGALQETINCITNSVQK